MNLRAGDPTRRCRTELCDTLRGLDIQIDIGIHPILARQLTSSADCEMFSQSWKAVQGLVFTVAIVSLHPQQFYRDR